MRKQAFAALLMAAVLLGGCNYPDVAPIRPAAQENVTATAQMTIKESTSEPTLRAAVENVEENDMDWLKKLTELVPPTAEPLNPVTDEMRKAAEEKLGTKLPDDYIALINTYGDGCFGYTFNVYSPFSEGRYSSLLDNEEKYFYESGKEFEEQLSEDMRKSSREFFESRRGADGKVPLYGGYCDNEGFPFDYYPAENGLLACCQCDGQYTIYWKTGGEKWTIVAYERGGDYSEFDMSLTEFLYKEIAREINFGDLYAYLTEKGNVFIPAGENEKETGENTVYGGMLSMYNYTKITAEEYNNATEGMTLHGEHYYENGAAGDKEFALFYGKMQTLFGEPNSTFDDYENMYSYCIKAGDGGETVYFEVYGNAAPSYTVPVTDNEELKQRYIQAARMLRNVVEKAEPKDYTWSGVYEDVPVNITYIVKDGAAEVVSEMGEPDF